MMYFYFFPLGKAIRVSACCFISLLPRSMFHLICLPKQLQVYSLGSRINIFCQTQKKGKTCYTEYEVINLLELFIDSIFDEFGGHIFFNKSSSSPLDETMSIYFYTPMRQSLYKHLSKTK
jgi:hypothetical protein